MTRRPPREPELVIFDCDGVLVDTEPIAVRIDRIVLERNGWTLTEDEVADRFVGTSPGFIAAELQRHLGRPPEPEWEREFETMFRAACEAELATVEGVVDVLDGLGLPACVASNGSHARMRMMLGLTGLYDRFAGRIFSAEDVERGKPAPDLFLHAAANMGAEPEACVVIEDSRYGVQAALAAGMRVLAFSGGLTSAEVLRAEGAATFQRMDELPALLGVRT